VILLLNDCSVHGQFEGPLSFADALGVVLGMRGVARRFEREIYCRRDLSSLMATQSLSFLQAVQQMGRDQQRSVLQWLNRQGPFWDDSRIHSADEMFTSNGEVVTDLALAEAASRRLAGVDCRTTSFLPSKWADAKLSVSCHESDEAPSVEVLVDNYIDATTLEQALSAQPTVCRDWPELAERCTTRFTGLHFSNSCFDSLIGHPFVPSAAERIVDLLLVLERLNAAFDDHGRRTAAGHYLYQEHFTGGKSWFSDSSETEKRDFRSDLTFRHPQRPGEWLFCPWHAKIKSPQYRIHFSYPVSSEDTLYVVYVGPKITRR
jgi:hypothetical protein